MSGSVHTSGLCDRCAFSVAIVSARKSVFVLCKKSGADSDFAKYPRLPVLECRGFEQKNPPDEFPSESQ
jgi:hypothetical protein